LTAASDATVGIYAGGSTGSFVSTCEKYTFSSNSVANGTSLSSARGFLNSTSSTPGGL
jgi:hypothetical protein